MAKDKNTEEYLNEPVDTYNHCIDSLRYSVERFYKPEMKNVQVLNKQSMQSNQWAYKEDNAC